MTHQHSPACTAQRDQNYAAMRDGLDALVHHSLDVLDELDDQGAAELLAASIANRNFAGCTLASYLAIAIVRLQRPEAGRG